MLKHRSSIEAVRIPAEIMAEIVSMRKKIEEAAIVKVGTVDVEDSVVKNWEIVADGEKIGLISRMEIATCDGRIVGLFEMAAGGGEIVVSGEKLQLDIHVKAGHPCF